MEPVIQWFTYDDIQQNEALLERVVRTPGAKVARDFMLKGDYKLLRYIASVGHNDDWAVYVSSQSRSKEEVYANGYKTSRDLGERVFPELAARLKWRY